MLHTIDEDSSFMNTDFTGEERKRKNKLYYSVIKVHSPPISVSLSEAEVRRRGGGQRPSLPSSVLVSAI